MDPTAPCDERGEGCEKSGENDEASSEPEPELEAERKAKASDRLELWEARQANDLRPAPAYCASLPPGCCAPGSDGLNVCVLQVNTQAECNSPEDIYSQSPVSSP